MEHSRPFFLIAALLFFNVFTVWSDVRNEEQQSYFLNEEDEEYFAVPAPAPAPAPFNISGCGGHCKVRCSRHSRQNVCMRACGTCCAKCRCVPSGTFGNREQCGACYTNWTTHGNKPKCP